MRAWVLVIAIAGCSGGGARKRGGPPVFSDPRVCSDANANAEARGMGEFVFPHSSEVYWECAEAEWAQATIDCAAAATTKDELYACAAADEDVKAALPDPALCAALERGIAAAPNQMHGEQGSPYGDDGVDDGQVFFESLIAVPEAQCAIRFRDDLTGLLQCWMTELDDLAAIDAAYLQWQRRITACVPEGWTAEEGAPVDGLIYTEWSTDHRATDLPRVVLYRLAYANDDARANYGLELEIDHTPARISRSVCALASAATDAARDGFASARAEQVEDGVFETTLELPQGFDCLIEDGAPAKLHCEVNIDTAAEADAAYAEITEQLAGCMASGWSAANGPAVFVERWDDATDHGVTMLVPADI